MVPDDSDLQPIAYAPPAVTPGRIPVGSAIQTTRSGGTVVKHAGPEVSFDGTDGVTLMKMAACVMHVTARHGAYPVADPANITSQEIKTPRRFNTVADAQM